MMWAVELEEEQNADMEHCPQRHCLQRSFVLLIVDAFLFLWLSCWLKVARARCVAGNLAGNV
jgi:hypothetical protein